MELTIYPESLKKKMTLLKHFKRYMLLNLSKAGRTVRHNVTDAISRIPHLQTWFRTEYATIMHLTNGSVQVIKLFHKFTNSIN